MMHDIRIWSLTASLPALTFANLTFANLANLATDSDPSDPTPKTGIHQNHIHSLRPTRRVTASTCTEHSDTITGLVTGDLII